MKSTRHTIESGESSQPSQSFQKAYCQTNDQFFAEQLKNISTLSHSPDHTTLLLYCIKKNDLKMVSHCLETIDPITLNRSVLNFTPLTLSLTLRNINICKMLLSHNEIDVAQSDSWRQYPLSLACQISSRELVTEILKHPSADVNQLDKNNESPLTRAIFDQQWEIVDLLIATNQIDPGKHPEALNWAIRYQEIPIVERLICIGFSCNLTTPKELFSSDQDSEVSELFEEGGKLPLFWSLYVQSVKLCSLLTSHGATIKDSDAFGEHLVISILKANNLSQFYKENHIQLNHDKKPADQLTPTRTQKLAFFTPAPEGISSQSSLFNSIIRLIQLKDVQGVLTSKFLASLSDLDTSEPITDDLGNTLLHYAVLVPDNVEIIKALILKGGCDINTLNKHKQTPLLLALSQPFCSLPNVEYLIENGSDITHQDDFGGALHYAIQYESLAAIELLLNYNADPTSTSSSGCKAMDLAFRTSVSAYKLIESKKNEMLNNQQAVLGHGILEGYLTSLQEILFKNKDWTQLILLMDETPSHQCIYTENISALNDTELRPILIVMRNIIDLTPTEISTSFAKLGILTQEELSWYYKNLCQHYFKYLISLSTALDLDRALCSVIDISKNSIIPLTLKPPEIEKTGSTNDHFIKSLNNQIDALQSKTADWSQKILANTLILRWRLLKQSEDTMKQKQSGADYDQAMKIYDQLYEKSTNYPQKIGLLITMLEWSSADKLLLAKYAKTVLNSHNPIYLKKAFERIGGTGNYQEARAKELLKRFIPAPTQLSQNSKFEIASNPAK
jgi:ankyrin repeat protein